MNDSTLISNLPDRTNSTSAQNNNLSHEINSNKYIPLQVHNNPFGFKNDIDVQEEIHHRLPSRDIPNDQTNYTHDEVVQVNYIEEPKNLNDYVQDYKEEESARIRKHNKEKNSISRFDKTISQLQEFVLIAILYFISNMTIINILIKRYFSILGMFENDGNFNFYGKVFKSISFALFYCLSFQVINNYFPTI